MILEILIYLFNYLWCVFDLAGFDILHKTPLDLVAISKRQKYGERGRPNQHQVSKSRRRPTLSKWFSHPEAILVWRNIRILW